MSQRNLILGYIRYHFLTTQRPFLLQDEIYHGKNTGYIIRDRTIMKNKMNADEEREIHVILPPSQFNAQRHDKIANFISNL